MAENPKGIWKNFKEEMKVNNAKFADDRKALSAQTKTRAKEIDAENKAKLAAIERPKADYSKMSVRKFLGLIWLLVASFPLFLFGLFLLVAAVVLLWDIVFGL